MPEPLTVLGVGGSLSARSRTGLLLRAALREARGQDMRPCLYDLRKHQLPVFEPDPDVELPAAAKLLLSEARAAHALVFASPVYHGTVSGAFKNAIDYLQLLADDEPPWLAGKAIGLLSVCTGYGAGTQAVTAMDHMCRALRAVSVPTVVVVTEDSFGTGNTMDARIASRLGRLIGELRTYATAPLDLAVTS